MMDQMLLMSVRILNAPIQVIFWITLTGGYVLSTSGELFHIFATST